MSSKPARIKIGPQPGKQEMFLASPADIAIYGGAAGGGKSYALLLDPIRWCVGPKAKQEFRAVFFRRSKPDLRQGGGIWDTSKSIYGYFGCKKRESPAHEWIWPSGAEIKMTHLQHDEDARGHQGGQYSALYFDELTHFSEWQFWFMFGRIRSAADGGIDGYVRATCNPDSSSWVKGFLRWWLDDDGRYAREDRAGVIRWMIRDSDNGKIIWGDSPEELAEKNPEAFYNKDGQRISNVRQRCTSVTFIPSSLTDNKILTSNDPRYESKLSAQASPVMIARMLKGDWAITFDAGSVFSPEWFPIVDDIDRSKIVTRVRAWDLAGGRGGSGDFSAGALMSIDVDGNVTVEDLEVRKVSSGEVFDLVAEIANLDGPAVPILIEQPRGGAGNLVVGAVQNRLPNYMIHSAVIGADDKTKRAQPVAGAAHRGRVKLLRGAWNAGFLGEATGFPEGRHDDQVDAVVHGWLYLTGTANGAPMAVVRRW